MSNQNIQEVFGKFAAVLASGPVLFNTYKDAASALSMYQNGKEHKDLAERYCESQGIGLDTKNAQTKINIIMSFLTFADTLEVEVEDEDEAIEPQF
jgi:hypothetical protein